MKTPEPNPLSILREAIRAVPSVRYALGVAGVFAAVAIIVTFNLSLRAGTFGFAALLLAMILLLVFANVALRAPADFRWPGTVLIWFSVLFLIATAVLLFTSVFWARPLDLRSLLDIPTPLQQGPPPAIQKAPEMTGPSAVVQQPPPGTGKPTAGTHPRTPIKTPVDDHIAVDWEHRGDLAAQSAILEEIKWAKNGKPAAEYSIDKKPGDEYAPIIAGFTQASSAWKKAVDAAKDPKYIKSLHEKISSSSGLTCENAGSYRIVCYRNGSDYDVLNFIDGPQSGKHIKINP